MKKAKGKKKAQSKRKLTFKLKPILITVTALVLVVAVTVYLSKNAFFEKNKESKKAIVNYAVTNIEESLRDAHHYETYQLESILLQGAGDVCTFEFLVRNLSKEKAKAQDLTITFLSSSGKVLGEADVSIPELKSLEATTVNTFTSNDKVMDSFDFKISKAKTVNLKKEKDSHSHN